MIKHLGTLSIALVWISTYLLLSLQSVHKHDSISKHAARTKRTFVLFAIAEIVITALYGVFLYAWLIPQYQLGTAFAIIAATGLTGTIIAALVREKAGWQHYVHGIGAYAMAATLPLSTVLLVNSPLVSISAKIILLSTLIGMFLLLLLGMRSPKKGSWLTVFRLQVGFYLMYHISIITVIYIT